MNALANSRAGEIKKYLKHGFNGWPPVTFQRYTVRTAMPRTTIIDDPADNLLANYMKLILTRSTCATTRYCPSQFAATAGTCTTQCGARRATLATKCGTSRGN